MKEDQYDVGLQLIDLARLLDKRSAEIQRPIEVSGRINTVLSATPPSHDVEPFTEKICASSGYKWLGRNDHFGAAKRLFDECIKESMAPPWRIAKQKVDFVRTVSQWAGFCFCAPLWSPSYATAEQKRQAVSTADSLIDLMGQGACMSDVLENFQLERSLTRYRDELTVTQSSRQYSGPKARQRDMLELIAEHLLDIGLEKRHTVNIVETIAPLLGFSPSHRTVQRYVRRADCRN